jgi:hypothetical protein
MIIVKKKNQGGIYSLYPVSIYTPPIRTEEIENDRQIGQ